MSDDESKVPFDGDMSSNNNLPNIESLSIEFNFKTQTCMECGRITHELCPKEEITSPEFIDKCAVCISICAKYECMKKLEGENNELGLCMI